MSKLNCIACSVLRRELEKIQEKYHPFESISYIDSSYHFFPLQLDEKIQELIEQQDNDVFISYGDCCPSMHDLTSQKGVKRATVINCIEQVMGRESYREYMKKGAFFILPEWAERWPEIFASKLGIISEDLKGILSQHYKIFLYLDTGIIKIPKASLDELSEHFSIPWKRFQVNLEEDFLQSILG